MKWFLIILLFVFAPLKSQHQLTYNGHRVNYNGNKITTNKIDFEIETINLLGRVPSQTYARRVLIDDLIKAGKDNGWWIKGDLIKVIACSDTSFAKINWIKDANHSIYNGAITFIQDKGIAHNGTTSYTDLNFIPSIDGEKYTLNSASFIISINDNAIPASSVFYGSGVINGVNRTYLQPGSSGGVLYAGINNTGSNYAIRNSITTKGFSGVIRTSSSNINGYVNLGFKSNAITSTGLPAISLWIGGINNGGALYLPHNKQYSSVFIGAALTEEEYNHYIIDMNNYFKAISNELIDDDLFIELTQNPTVDFIIGQSNAVAYGGVLDSLPAEYLGIKSDRSIYDLYLNTVTKLYPYYNTYSAKGVNYWGEEQPFLRDAKDSLTNPVSIIKVCEIGAGITKFIDSASTGVYYYQLTEAIDRYIYYCTERSLTPDFRSMLWMQGESDCNIGNIGNYEYHLRDFITDIRNYNPLLADLKIVIVKINDDFSDLTQTYVDQMNAIYDEIYSDTPNIYLIDVNSLGISSDGNLHYTKTGILEIGNEWSKIIN